MVMMFMMRSLLKFKKVSKDIVEITRVHGLHGYKGDLFVRVLPL